MFLASKKEAQRFCSLSNLHGYRFIILPKRMLIERVFWLFICTCSIITAITLVMISWYNFQKDPISLVTDSNNLLISNYDFPAVTICSNNQISKKKVHSLATKFTNFTAFELLENLKLVNTFLIRHSTLNESLIRKVSYLQNVFAVLNITIYDVLKKSAYSCDSMIIKCKWKGVSIKCSYWFEQIKTPDGICCSFNYYAFKKNIYGRKNGESISDKPQRMSTCGYHTGLIVVINNYPEDYTSSYIPSIGQLVKIHNPYDYPDWNAINVFHPKGVINFVSITPTRTFALADIKKLPLDYRKCLYPEEKNLLYFKQYSYHNCLVECRLNMTRRMCGCVPIYYLPEELSDVKENICNLLDIPCLANIEGIIRNVLPYSNVTNRNLGARSHLIKRCGCYEDCETTIYSTEHDTASFSVNYTTYSSHLFSGIELKNASVLHVFFKDIVGIRNRRHKKFTWDTLVAFYGGLLGIFLGFSIVSGIEIVYFCITTIFDHVMQTKVKNRIQNHKITHVKINNNISPRPKVKFGW